MKKFLDYIDDCLLSEDPRLAIPAIFFVGTMLIISCFITVILIIQLAIWIKWWLLLIPAGIFLMFFYNFYKEIKND